LMSQPKLFWTKTLRVHIVTHQNYQKFHDKITSYMNCPAIGDMA